METTVNNSATRNEIEAKALFEQAKEDLLLDMKARDIGAILWDNEQCGFHFPPEVTVTNSDGKSDAWTIHGMYRVDETLYLIGPGAPIGVENYYKRGVQTKPCAVTLTEDQATRTIGIPNEGRGYTTQGSVQQWLTCTDCYFKALDLLNAL
ncbi:MAG: hypothetical protein NC402_03810 [Prevotella sp.]|nr:hypothetical protein [Prevotella sp.]MCM1074890.1 hypothetical protein [Ruminococcus sp.]